MTKCHIFVRQNVTHYERIIFKLDPKRTGKSTTRFNR